MMESDLALENGVRAGESSRLRGAVSSDKRVFPGRKTFSSCGLTKDLHLAAVRPLGGGRWLAEWLTRRLKGHCAVHKKLDGGEGAT